MHNLRDHGEGSHNVVDDTAFGGGPGMVFKAAPLAAAVKEARHDDGGGGATVSPVVLMDPQGERLTQAIVDQFASLDDIIIVSGRYEGVDERARQHLITHEISIGDYVLSGGELPAMVFIEAVARRVPGVLGGEDSGKADSFASGLLQYPQYTRPAEWEGEPSRTSSSPATMPESINGGANNPCCEPSNAARTSSKPPPSPPLTKTSYAKTAGRANIFRPTPPPAKASRHSRERGNPTSIAQPTPLTPYNNPPPRYAKTAAALLSGIL